MALSLSLAPSFFKLSCMALMHIKPSENEHIIGSLSNHDDDGNKNPSNLHIWQWNRTFARFAPAFFIFWHFEDVLVLSMTWNDLFCRCVDDVSIWGQRFNFVFLCPKRWFQFNSSKVTTHFSIIMTLNNWKMISETRSHIFRWRSRFRRRRVCLSFLITANQPKLNYAKHGDTIRETVT